MNPGIYYVYALYRADAVEPFYIGKGKGDRINHHERAARAGRRYPGTAPIIRQIWAGGGAIRCVKIVEHLAEVDAYEIETDLIRLVGRQPNGPLINLANGGAWGLTAEAIERRTASRRGKKRSPEIGAKISASKMGHTVSAETRAKISSALVGRKASPETIARRSASLKGHPAAPGSAERIGALWRGRQMPPEMREKLRIAARKQRADAKARHEAEFKALIRRHLAEIRQKHGDT